MATDPALVPAVALNDGTTIPQIGFGTWQVPADEAEAATREALAVGYRHVDTAAVYANEAEVGQAIRGSGLARDEVYVTTKLWNCDQGYDNALRAFDTSMAKLGLEQLDLYLARREDWPRGASGRPWSFVGQLDLAELPLGVRPVVHPDADTGDGAGQQVGQGGAPAPRADDGDLHAGRLSRRAARTVAGTSSRSHTSPQAASARSA